MHRQTVEKLKKISQLERFAAGEYICHEGQPGNNMYVILEGEVGIFLTDLVGTIREISRIKGGGFFGEMAIFDQLPRSASCIALSDTICIAINRENLAPFLATCPEIVEKMLVNMSMRIRALDDKLFTHREEGAASRHSKAPFSLPAEYAGHSLPEPAQDPQYIQQSSHACPLCGQVFRVAAIERHRLPVETMEPDGRVRYAGPDPLWYEVLTCPHCLYSNHYLSFFKVNDANHRKMKETVQGQYEKIMMAKGRHNYATPFDRLIVSYLQAIHLNECIKLGDDALTGALSLHLYWLARDTGDERFIAYCAKNAVAKLTQALDFDRVSDETIRCSLALSLAHVLLYLGFADSAKKYCAIAANSPDAQMKSFADAFLLRIG